MNEIRCHRDFGICLIQCKLMGESGECLEKLYYEKMIELVDYIVNCGVKTR